MLLIAEASATLDCTGLEGLTLSFRFRTGLSNEHLQSGFRTKICGNILFTHTYCVSTHCTFVWRVLIHSEYSRAVSRRHDFSEIVTMINMNFSSSQIMPCFSIINVKSHAVSQYRSPRCIPYCFHTNLVLELDLFVIQIFFPSTRKQFLLHFWTEIY